MTPLTRPTEEDKHFHLPGIDCTRVKNSTVWDQQRQQRHMTPCCVEASLEFPCYPAEQYCVVGLGYFCVVLLLNI